METEILEVGNEGLMMNGERRREEEAIAIAQSGLRLRRIEYGDGKLEM